MSVTTSAMTSLAISSASIISSSVSSSAELSTIARPFLWPETTRSRRLFSRRSSSVGQATSSPSTWPMRTAPRLVSNGRPEMRTAAKAAIIAQTSAL